MDIQFDNKYYYIELSQSERRIKMKDDLLILKLLKIPVAVIKYLSTMMAMLTYLPNYLVILMLDAIIFNEKLSSTFFFYAISWPLRLLAQVTVIAIFCLEFYALYMLLSISHFHWGVQLLLTFIAFQGVLALMRHGYLTMIKKYSPTKLKSPKQHLLQLFNLFTDILGIILALFNVLLIINIKQILNYQYNPHIQYNYLKYVAKLIHKSVLDIIKLFYIQIFFRIFPWRYKHSLQQVQKQDGNVLQLTVLLTLLFLATLLDLIFFAMFGIYCAYIHPRRKIYRSKLSESYQKYKVTGNFFLNTLSQVAQCLILIFCMPFKYRFAKQVLLLVTAPQNNYDKHFWLETFFVLKLALVKIPSLICQLVLLISIYKYRKVKVIIKQKQKKMPANAEQSDKLFEKQQKSNAAPSGNVQDKSITKVKVNKYSKQNRYNQKEYVVFRCFVELLQQIPFLVLVPVCTIQKIWNVKWLKFIIDTKYDLRVSYVINYFFKNINDYLYSLPCLLLILILGSYDPLKQKSIIKTQLTKRRQLINKLPNINKQITNQQLAFYSYENAIMPKICNQNIQQIREDIFFLPLFLLSRLTLISLMDCQSPSSSVQLFQSLWMLFYKRRVKKSKYFEQYEAFQKIDQAAGMINNSRQRLRFWKFAHKSVRHRMIAKIISFLMPKRRAQKSIANAKIQTNFSAISNHYWHQYNITMNLLSYLLYFVIEMIISLFGAIILFPLTLWRMPTFVVLFKTHKYNKKYFFTILFKLYKQMLVDIFYLFPRIFIFILFPRACITFYSKTILRYSEFGIDQFKKIQIAKMWYLNNKVLKDGFYLYALFFKIMFVKIFWIRKRDMNQQLMQRDIRISRYAIDFLTTPQQTPNVKQLKIIYNIQNPNAFIIKQQEVKEHYKQQIQNEEKKKKKHDINQLGLSIQGITDPYFYQTIEDIPYLLLMFFLLFTLPWRVFYIKNALFMMRDDKIYRNQFIKLLKMISKDYQCIFLYFILVCTIVKAKRAARLFYRNFKINFYVSTLKYSHLKQLRAQLKQAGQFYYSLIIVIASFIFGPYRFKQIFTNVRKLYKKYKQQRQQEQKNKKMYDNTLKLGKSLELLTTIGHNSLCHVFRFLNTRQLMVMTQVSKYFYDSIKQKDEVWMQQWERIYAAKFTAFTLKNDLNLTNYNLMCIQKYKQEHYGHMQGDRNRFYALAVRQFNISTFETHLDLKLQLERVLPTRVFTKIFTCLRYDEFTGYGPEETWPRPDDNQQYIALFNIQRRQVVQLTQEKAFLSCFFERPVQFFISKLNRFFQQNTHRRKRQITFILFVIVTPLSIIWTVISLWSWIWEFDILFGYKFLGVVHAILFWILFYTRCLHQLPTWNSLHPFDLIEDVKYIIRVTVQFIKDKSIETGNFIKRNFQRYILKPIKVVSRKIYSMMRWAGRKVKYGADLFVQKVAKPLYISISHKIVAAWILIKDIFNSFIMSIKRIVVFFIKIFKKIYQTLFQIVKSISKAYSNFLEYTLRLALSYGNIGQLIFTVIIIIGMVSPTLCCYFYYSQRWFIILSTLMTMVLMVTGYKHLNRMKERVLKQ